MNIPFGWLLVITAGLSGFYLVVGDISKLWVPAELLILAGCALGSLVAANQWRNIKNIGYALRRAFVTSRSSRAVNLELLSLMFELLQRIKRDGALSIDNDVQSPYSSQIFSKYPKLLKKERLIEFVTDYLRMTVDGTTTLAQLDAVMHQEIEVLGQEAIEPAHSLDVLADSMPAFGIVAAITGVISALDSLSGGHGSPATVGAEVASALVGTLLGVFAAYAIFAPIARTIEQICQSELMPFKAVKEILIANFSNFSPMVAVEYGRKVLYTDQRPSMAELEASIMSKSGQSLRG